jgi:hypothetical protein
MGRRAHEVLLSRGVIPQQTISEVRAARAVVTPQIGVQEEKTQFTFPSPLLAFLPQVQKLDPHSYIKPEELVSIFRITAGLKQRFFQRILLSVYQRAFKHKDDVLVRTTRFYTCLHESGKLESYLNGDM